MQIKTSYVNSLYKLKYTSNYISFNKKQNIINIKIFSNIR